MNHYLHGCCCALIKLGLEASAVPYVRTKLRDSDQLPVANSSQAFWKNFDENPSMTGEESSIGMPSASKAASENDYGYGAANGLYGVGGVDADQNKSDRDLRLKSAIREAIRSNESYDQSYAPEAATTQPFGPKMGAYALNPLKPTMIGPKSPASLGYNKTKNMSINALKPKNTLTGTSPPSLIKPTTLPLQQKLDDAFIPNQSAVTSMSHLGKIPTQ